MSRQDLDEALDNIAALTEQRDALRTALELIQKLAEVNFTNGAADDALEAIAHMATQALAGQPESSVREKKYEHGCPECLAEVSADGEYCKDCASAAWPTASRH